MGSKVTTVDGRAAPCVPSTNVVASERILSAAAGMKLIWANLSRLRYTSGLFLGLAGGYLAYRGITGFCPLRQSIARWHRIGRLLRRFNQLAETGDVTDAAGPAGHLRLTGSEECGPKPKSARGTAMGSTSGEIKPQRNAVDEASMESFPASDPPAWTGERI